MLDIVPFENDGFVACGDMVPQSPDTGNQDCWFLKIDSLGCEIQNCILSSENQINKNAVVEIYPNPFFDKINIKNEFQNNFNITIFDLLGTELLGRFLSIES